jgi:uncharacterized coiled-coil protein SlyX
LEQQLEKQQRLNAQNIILKSKFTSIIKISLTGILEEERGVAGYKATQEKIQEISQAKSELDADKGKTLEEISKVVTEINQQIKEKKAKLTPLIKELRILRQQYQELEVQHTEKKTAYESATLGIQRYSKLCSIQYTSIHSYTLTLQ